MNSNLKIGDRVIVNRHFNGKFGKGVIVNINHNPSGEVHFYSIREDGSNLSHSWSYNVFENDEIELDLEAMREIKLKELLD